MPTLYASTTVANIHFMATLRNGKVYITAFFQELHGQLVKGMRQETWESNLFSMDEGYRDMYRTVWQFDETQRWYKITIKSWELEHKLLHVDRKRIEAEKFLVSLKDEKDSIERTLENIRRIP
jgi:hypothetical protein